MGLGFLRSNAKRFSKFGNGRGKKAKWKKPTGRDNKMREKVAGHPKVVSIGYSTGKKKSNVVNVFNLEDLKKVTKENIAHLRKIGLKKKVEVLKEAKKKGITFDNINVHAFLKDLEKKNKLMENKK